MENLKKLRKNLGKTQAEVAAELNLNVITYGRYENGVFDPPIEKLIEIANYFGCSIDYLVAKSNKNEKSKSKNDLLNAIGTLTDGECEKVLSFIKGMKS